MFESAENWQNAGFQLKFGHRHLMIGEHPSIPGYLIKKFPDTTSREFQIENFMKRINGANTLRKFIKEHKFKRFQVPEKWLYELPEVFNQGETKGYVLVVKKMDICVKENRTQYYNMDKKTLSHLCRIILQVGGIDARPRNIPFTHSGKIAFIDTEHVGNKKASFFKYTLPKLNKKNQKYAKELWTNLENKQK